MQVCFLVRTTVTVLLGRKGGCLYDAYGYCVFKCFEGFSTLICGCLGVQNS